MSNRSGTYDRVAGPGRNDVHETSRGDAALLSFRNNREGHCGHRNLRAANGSGTLTWLNLPDFSPHPKQIGCPDPTLCKPIWGPNSMLIDSFHAEERPLMRAWLSAWQRVHGMLRVTAWSVAAGGRIMRAILILEKEK